METAAPKKAAIKGGPEKCLAASRALPVCQPGGQEEVSDKGQSKEKPRNEKGEPDFEHGNAEEIKDGEASPTVGSPGVRIQGIDPGIAVLAGAILQFEGLHTKQSLTQTDGGWQAYERLKV
jgi:hypothetical protein